MSFDIIKQLSITLRNVLVINMITITLLLISLICRRQLQWITMNYNEWKLRNTASGLACDEVSIS